MKFNIAYQPNGKQTSVTVDDEAKWGKLIDYRLGQEFNGGIISEDLEGYSLRITGGMDKQGFGMKHGIFKAGRVKLLLEKGYKGYNCHRSGQRRRKGVRGCIVGRDLGTIHCIIAKKGPKEIKDVTDVNEPRRLGPKRANRIRSFFGLPRHWDLKGTKKTTDAKVEVENFDVTRYVVKRFVETEGDNDKKYYKAPNVQRLVTAQRLRRKRDKKTRTLAAVINSQKLYKSFLDSVKKAKKVE